MAQAERETVDRIPPQNLDAEMSVLGSILLSNEATATAVHVIKPQDFYSPAHQLLFGLMVELYDQNRPIDPLILKEELTRRDLLQKTGGTEYLVRLMDVVPSAANVEQYAEIVREKAVLRGLIEAGTEVVRAAHSGAFTYRQLADLAESRILAVSREAESGEAATLRDLLHQTFDRLDVFQGREGRLTGLETGFPDLDDLTSGLQPGELVVVAGRPSMGKTSFALNVAEHVGAQLRKHVVVFSLEMSKQQVAQNMLCSHAEVDAMKLRKGMVSHSEVQLLVNTASILSDAPILIDDTSTLTALELRAKARRLHRRQPLALIVVDYLQLLEYAAWPKAENRQQEISQISRSLKSLARELHIPVIAISQLNRAADTREDHRPRMADLRESGAIEQDADLILFLFREEYYKESEENRGRAEVLIAKQRNGPTGNVQLHFAASHMRFRPLTSRVEPF
jgi:replicative DNA helicase